MKRLLLLLLPVLLPIAAHAQAPVVPTASTFTTCLAPDGTGGYWAGAEDDGLFHRSPTGEWMQFATQKELGDASVTCVTVDPSRRVWVGTASAGVAVFDGATWKRFGTWNGPLAARINDLAIDAEGSVWGATDVGLFRWNDKSGWQYPGVFASDPTTQTLARRPVYALAFDSQNRVLSATDEGLNRLSIAGGKETVEPIGRAKSPLQPPRASGEGFLPGPIHDVAVDSQNSIWCATRFGVCLSRNDGKAWQFLRGADWLDNVKGSAVPLTIDATNPAEDPLGEDWVTTLSPTPNGKMWLGFRQKGAEERDCRTLELIVSTRDVATATTVPNTVGDWTSAIVPLGGDNAAFARYGGGLGALFAVKPPTLTPNGTPAKPAPLSISQTPPELLTRLTRELEARTPLAAGQGAFYSLDRQTRGDWPLRYGNAGLELFGVVVGSFAYGPFNLSVSTGPHRAGAEADCYIYTQWLTSNNPNVVQMPVRGIRRQSEINDGTWQGDKYPFSFDGPDLWATFQVPEGSHRVALYWFNKDGHSGNNRMRDHRIQLFPGDIPQTECLRREPMATARLWSGWNGQYATFAVRGPAKYQIRMARDRSHATQLQAIFFDRLGAPQPKPEWIPDRLPMPANPPLEATAPFAPALTLWQACDLAETRGIPCAPERLLALRAAKEMGAPETLLAAWRVQAAAWDEEGNDHQSLAVPPAK